jgi:hypothetical protein
VTVEQLLDSMLTRWHVLLLGLLLTAVMCVVTWRAPGVYWATTKVYLLVPATSSRPNQLAPDDSVAIPLAGLIATEINDGVPLRRATSPDATLVDEGIYDGWAVFIPDSGGQWAHNFTESSLIVQASGATPEVVQSRMNELFDRIARLVAAHEDAAQVPLGSRVEFALSPSTVAVQYSNGHRSRALVVVALLGFGLSVAACIVVDRALMARRRRGDQANDGIGDARVRDTAGGDQDGAGRESAGAPPGVAADRGGDRTASGDA